MGCMGITEKDGIYYLGLRACGVGFKVYRKGKMTTDDICCCFFDG